MWTIEHERANEIADAVLMSYSSNAQKYGECSVDRCQSSRQGRTSREEYVARGETSSLSQCRDEEWTDALTVALMCFVRYSS